VTATLRGIAVALVLLLPIGPVLATYTVTTTADAGDGSLRWAIEQANAQPTDVAYIRFRAALSGSTISPLTPLPAVTLDRTSIEGDVDLGGDPDITIDGHNLTTGSGLRIEAEYCDVVGLAIVRCPSSGLRRPHRADTIGAGPDPASVRGDLAELPLSRRGERIGVLDHMSATTWRAARCSRDHCGTRWAEARATSARGQDESSRPPSRGRGGRPVRGRSGGPSPACRAGSRARGGGAWPGAGGWRGRSPSASSRW
jgi:hypothetical protein